MMLSYSETTMMNYLLNRPRQEELQTLGTCKLLKSQITRRECTEAELRPEEINRFNS